GWAKAGMAVPNCSTKRRLCPPYPLGPFQPRHDRAAHDPVFVVLGEEWQLLGEMSDTLAIGRLVERVRHVGAPIAALRAERIEAAFDAWQHVAVRIGLG